MYKVSQKTQVEIDAEDAGDLVAQVLMQDFDDLSRDVVSAQYRLTTLKPYELEDLQNHIEMRNAIKTVLRYYMTHREYTEFMELQRVYGNVV